MYYGCNKPIRTVTNPKVYFSLENPINFRDNVIHCSVSGSLLK